MDSNAGVLQGIAEQLSTQITFANDLMSRLQGLETQHAMFQRQASEKQAQLRSASAALESSRSECADLRRKLAVAQDVSLKLTEECKANKVELASQARQIDSLERFSLEKRGELGTLTAEKEALARELAAGSLELREAKRAVRQAEEDTEERVSALTATNSALMRELTEARTRSAPLHAEVEAARNTVSRLGEELESLKRLKIDLMARLEKSNAALLASGQAARDAAAGEARLARALEEAGRRHEGTLLALANAQDACKAKEFELEDALGKAASMSQEALEAREEASACTRDSRALAEELAFVRAARGNDKEVWEKRLMESAEDLRRVAEEGRAREAQHASDMARRAEEVIAARREGEAAMEAAAGECNELGELLGKVRMESVSAARRWEEARVGYERRISELVARGAAESASAMAADSEAKSRLAASQEAQASAHAALSMLQAERDSFSADIQSIFESLAGEHAAVTRDREALEDAFGRLVERIEEMVGGDSVQASLTTAWYEEVKRTFVLLAERVQSEKARADVERDNFRSAELRVEEMRGRIILLEDALGRAEHESAARGAQIRKLEADIVSRAESYTTELRSAQTMVDELSGELQRAKERLAAAARSRVAAQEEAANAGIALGEAEARATARVLSLEAQVSGLTDALKQAQKEADDARVREESTRSSLTGSEGELIGLRAEREALAAELFAVQEEAKSVAASHSAQITALTASLGALDKQNKGAQTLLASLLEQRKSLELEVAKLSSTEAERFSVHSEHF